MRLSASLAGLPLRPRSDAPANQRACPSTGRRRAIAQPTLRQRTFARRAAVAKGLLMLKALWQGLSLGLVIAALMGAGLFRVWVHNDAVQAGYQLSAAEAQRKELRRTKQQLEVELAAEKSPERLTRLAQKLGLGPVSPERLLGAPRPSRSAP